MKNLFLALVAMVMFSGFSFKSNAQEITKEEAREKMAQVMVSFTEALKPIYQESKPASYDAFLAVLYPTAKPALTVEAKALLNDAYNYLRSNTASSVIKRDYDGVSLAKTLKQSVDTGKTSIIDLNELLTGTGPYSPHVQKSGGCSCKWYQLGCWVDCVFGDGTMDILLPIIIGLLL